MSTLVKNIQTVFDKMEKDTMPFYKIYSGDGKNLIDSNDSEKNVSLAIDRIKDIVNGLEGRILIQITGREPSKTTKGGDTRVYKYEVKLGGDAYNTPQAPANMGNANNFMMQAFITMMQQNHTQQMQFLTEKFALENRLKEAENKPLGNDNAFFWQQALVRFDRMFPAQNQPHAQPINGVGDPNATPTQPKRIMDKAQQDRLNAAIHELLKNDPKFLDNLEKLALLSRDKKELYNFAVSQLNNL